MPAVENERALAAVLADVKSEIKDFLQTRMAMLRFELRGKARAWKLAGPMAVCGLALLATAWLVFTGALIAILATAFYPSRFAYVIALVLVGAVYGLGGAMCAALAVRTAKLAGVVPERTLKVLKEDARWLHSEARGQYERTA
jgi:VIT1/CCC1 family predicted Fe2+/Mn2+ transporter